MTNSGLRKTTAMVQPLRPKRGGFLRPFARGTFTRDFLLGSGLYGSPQTDPDNGAPQADIFHFYKERLIQATALDRATREEERLARREKRPINPENIDRLTVRHIARLPYKSFGSTYHSFVAFFSILQQLGWVEFTGQEEPSAFQDNYEAGQPRKYFRLTEKGKAASHTAWANPSKALYGHRA